MREKQDFTNAEYKNVAKILKNTDILSNRNSYSILAGLFSM